MILELHRRAEAEVREAAVWYANQAAGLGHEFLEAIRQAFVDLESNPAGFAKLETLSPNAPFRRVLVKGFPYLIIYEVLSDEIFVFAVAHASRRPNYWRRRKRGGT